MDNAKIESIIEGILFVSGEAIEVKTIAEAIEMSVEDTEAIIKKLEYKYEKDDERGLKIVGFEGKYQLATKQNIFSYITKISQDIEKPKISPAMLETLAIVAYKQPITKLEVENIRGVKSDHVINKLVEYELVCEVGRAEKIGRPILFGTTDKFLVYFGLKDLGELPKMKETKVITEDNVDEEILKVKDEEEKKRLKLK